MLVPYQYIFASGPAEAPTMTYEAYDLVVVPFPFTDKSSEKRRPALVLSECDKFNVICGHSVLAMVTSKENAACPLDSEIKDLEQAGLNATSVIRQKIFKVCT
jgi:mRNA interferase MazF